jgi:hypothetical protein
MVTFILPQRRNTFITVHIFEHGRLVHGMYKIHTLVPVQKQGPADMAMATGSVQIQETLKTQ